MGKERILLMSIILFTASVIIAVEAVIIGLGYAAYRLAKWAFWSYAYRDTFEQDESGRYRLKPDHLPYEP